MSEKEVNSWFKSLPGKLQRELARDLQRIAGELKEDIQAATPVGATGKLRESVRVRRGRKTLEYFVEGGGPTTTKAYAGRTSYQRQVDVGSGDTQGIPKGGKGNVAYDYALGVEFGNTRVPAQSFFYNTYRARQDDIREEIEEAVFDVLRRA